MAKKSSVREPGCASALTGFLLFPVFAGVGIFLGGLVLGEPGTILGFFGGLMAFAGLWEKIFPKNP